MSENKKIKTTKTVKKVIKSAPKSAPKKASPEGEKRME